MDRIGLHRRAPAPAPAPRGHPRRPGRRPARGIAPTTIGVSRFGIGAEAPGAVAGIERCLRTGQAARFRYRNQSGQERAVHVWPIRLVLIKGEWYCFAWAPADRPDLRRWLAQQAQGVIDALGSDPTPMPATPAAANAVTISATTA